MPEKYTMQATMLLLGGLGACPSKNSKKFPLLALNLEAVLTEHYEFVNAMLGSYSYLYCNLRFNTGK